MPVARVAEATVAGGDVPTNGQGVVTLRGTITAATPTMTIDVYEWSHLLGSYCLRESRTITNKDTWSEDFILGACADVLYIGTSALDVSIAAYSITAQMKSSAV
jgi:hypothetical protein